MLKPYFLILFFLGILHPVSAQIHKIYVMADGSKTLDSSKAVSFILYQKIESDSAWATRLYDMQDSLLVIGSYKDQKFTIPHGRFIYYNLIKPVAPIHYKYNYGSHKVDTLKLKATKYISEKGYYLNGLKNGQWLEYDDSGKLMVSTNYVNGKKNGLCRIYNSEFGNLYKEGNYVDDLRSGTWYAFGLYNDTLATIQYKRGISQKESPYKNREHVFTMAKAGYDIPKYLNSELANAKFDKTGVFNVLYRFLLTKRGKLTNPEVSVTSVLEIDTAVIDKLLVAPN